MVCKCPITQEEREQGEAYRRSHKRLRTCPEPMTGGYSGHLLIVPFLARDWTQHGAHCKNEWFDYSQVASSAAESPPPMTARGLFLKMGTAPSQTAHAEMPLCQ